MLHGPDWPTGTVTTQSRTAGGTASASPPSHCVNFSSSIFVIPVALINNIGRHQSFGLFKELVLPQPQLHNLADSFPAVVSILYRKVCAEGNGQCVVELLRRK